MSNVLPPPAPSDARPAAGKSSTLNNLRMLSRSSPGVISLLLADALIELSDWATIVLVPWWITSQAGAGAIATYGIVLAFATLVAVPAAAPFGDRFCKASQMQSGLAALWMVSVAMAFCSAWPFHLAAIISLAVLRVLAKAFVDPSLSAILPELVTAQELPAAIQVQKTLRAVSGIFGPLLAGLLLSVANIWQAMVVFAVMSMVSWGASLFIPRRHGDAPARIDVRRWYNDLRVGVRAKWNVPMERGWTVVNFAVWIFQGPAVGILIPLKVKSLGLGGNWVGLGIGSLAVGVLLGSLFGSDSLVRLFGRYRVRIGLGCLEGVSLALVGLSGSAPVFVCGLLLAGFCNASMSLVGATHRALAIPKSYRVRMIAAGSVSTQVAGAIGPALVGLALTHCSVQVVYTSFGLLMAASVLGFLYVPRLKEFLSLDHMQIVDWYRLQYPDIFV